MRNYDYQEKWKKLLTPQVVVYLTTIHEYKGEQRLIVSRHADILNNLVNVAKIQSTESSNKIEGIYTSDDRLKKIVLDKTMPRSRNEREIAGYRDVLNIIHENNEHIPVRSTFILQLHRDLYKFENTGIGGAFKSADNLIEEEEAEGNKFIRFSPVPAWETPEAIDRLCEAYHYAVNNTEADPLLLIPMFVLDFLCIHPFRDGNGRMSRLLTLLLLYKSEYIVGKYISVEKLIEATKESYYDALQESSQKWHEEENDYLPFVTYLLGILAAAYREFFDRTRLIEEKKIAKPSRVAEEIKNHIGTITKSEIMERVPGVSQTTIQRTLAELIKQRKIIKIGNGRYTKYTWNWEEEQ
ncbi:Fic family protein [Hungatella effluvii]|uniref:Fic family protein n=1 Tax=Hungatella effluvii TaxID=1096246 RepID=A0A2V3YRB6_9FIRM|nr:Fic family protein [Hungatella effluvii]PXX56874.1 Fic family protein [Hungatella effluvii]